MSLRNGFLVFFALSTLALLPACSSSSTPAPTGSFTNSNLNGTYVFSFSGIDISDSNASSFAVAGTLAANGSGTITGGTIDVNDPALALAAGATSNVNTHLPITGEYSVTSDGRGTGHVTFAINGKSVTLGLDFVLLNSSQGLITRFDSAGTGSGTMDLQTSGVTQSSLQGSYAVGLNGVDSLGHFLGTVGAFTLDASGNATGLQDFNDNGSSTNLQALPLISPSTVLVGSPSGTAQLTTGATAFNTLSFDVWVIDSTHLKFIETDSVAVLAGDAFVSTGQTSFPGGTLVFTGLGDDTAGNPLAMGGVLASDGSSMITGGLQDVNDAGTVVQAPSVLGGFSSMNGRTQLTLNGIYNGDIVNSSLVTGNYTFAAYPYTGGVALLEIDSAGVTGGVAYPQTATSVATQPYGLNMTGSNSSGETDWIAEFSATNANLSGIYDANNMGSLIPGLSLGTGTYTLGSNGRGLAAFPNLQTNKSTSLVDAFNFTFYVVNSSTLVFLETDNDQLGIGSIGLQNASGSSAAQARFAPMLSQRFAHGFRARHP